LLAKERVKVVTGFGIGPGVAPLADLYMVRVFGCTGSTDVVTDAIDWAVHNNMDVISMSLGGAYGT
jgi:subtilisin family serine protease